MRKEVREKLESLKMTDVYSMILFALFKVKDVPEYSTLSELAYLLDQKSLFNLLDFYGGMTIRIPTTKEFKTILDALLLYEFVNLEHIEFNQALKLLEVENYKLSDIKSCYYKIVEVLDKYDFQRQ